MWNSRGRGRNFSGQHGLSAIAYMNVKEQDILTIIQTRRGSTRLPDKVLLPLRGKPLFVRQVERIKSARLCGRVIVATTGDREDDVIAEICRVEDWDCYR